MRIPLRSSALAVAFSTVVGAARGDVIVSGTLDHLHIEANQASVVEVLEALKQQFQIDYEWRAHADSTVDGEFSGSLSSILPRIFRGKDYAFRIDADNSVIVFIVAPQGPPSAVPIPPPPVEAHMIAEPPTSQPDFVGKQNPEAARLRQRPRHQADR